MHRNHRWNEREKHASMPSFEPTVLYLLTSYCRQPVTRSERDTQALPQFCGILLHRGVLETFRRWFACWGWSTGSSASCPALPRMCARKCATEHEVVELWTSRAWCLQKESLLHWHPSSWAAQSPRLFSRAGSWSPCQERAASRAAFHPRCSLLTIYPLLLSS